MKVWISKYALSEGITEHECDPPNGGDNRVFPGAPFFEFTSFKLGSEAHLSKEDAERAAEAARLKKIASLRKQIAKLEKLTFLSCPKTGGG
jgi:hypothetical protein